MVVCVYHTHFITDLHSFNLLQIKVVSNIFDACSPVDHSTTANTLYHFNIAKITAHISDKTSYSRAVEVGHS